MITMKQEEKLEEAKRLYEIANADQKYVLESLFPELRESEDERIRRQTLKVLNYYKDAEKSEGRMPTEIDECIAWLEKQKEQKPWSEEDKRWFKELKLMALSFSNDDSYRKKVFEWLKSLKERHTWKPSDEQIQVLQWCMPLWIEPKSKAVLESLLNDLKKLREEDV